MQKNFVPKIEKLNNPVSAQTESQELKIMQVNRYRLPKKESEKEVKTEEEVKSVE